VSDFDIPENPPAKAGGRSKKGSSDSPTPWRAFGQSRVGRGLIGGYSRLLIGESDIRYHLSQLLSLYHIL